MATNDSNFQAKINEGTNALSPAKTLPYLTVSSYQHFQNVNIPVDYNVLIPYFYLFLNSFIVLIC